jgi:hypothetical protein
MPSAIHFYRQEAAAPVDVRFHTLDRLLTGESSDRSGSNQPVTDQSEFFGIPRGLGRATATTSATFLPHCEQRIRGASSLSVTFQPTRRTSASGSISRHAPQSHTARTRKSADAILASVVSMPRTLAVGLSGRAE